MDLPIISTPPSGPMIDGMFSIFAPTYNVPAKSVAEILSDPNSLNMFTALGNAPDALLSSISGYGKTLLDEIQSLTDASNAATQKLQIAIAQSTTFYKEEQVDLQQIINSSGTGDIYIDQLSNGYYKLDVKGGIPSLVQYIPTLGTITDDKLGKNYSKYNSLDKSETSDFNQRYISMDASFYDGTDAPNNISFMRIIKADPSIQYPGNQIFPGVQQGQINPGSIQPGITETKFKQFILSSISTASQERMQIVETSRAFQALFYGSKPEILNLGGIIKNTRQNPWNANMTFLWDGLMRGSALVEQGNILQLYIDGTIYNGYPFGFQRSQIAPTDYLVSFSMSFIIKEKIMTNRNVGNYDNLYD